ncbi:hypothetical protein [uncultured Flavobacterium sp.]|uniref:hypothetical protein n=1 Tax=uncultured Flavobacterium sp. TaxID=165435 RepID=UPI0030EE5D1D|tara:strand:- start:1330 stop:2106 length:777 start_codon:yes stop_codon:yes gene_type:complete
MKNKIDSKIQNGYTLDTGSLIDESIATFKKTFLISGVAMILLGIIFAIIYGTLFIVIYGFSDLTSTMTQLQTSKSTAIGLLTTVIITTVTSGFFAPVTAGFIHANHLAKNNQEIGINVFFEFYKSKFFKDIFLSYLILGLTTGILNAGLVLINLEILSYIVQSVLALLTVFTLPLIIYGNQNFENAITKSIQLFFKQPILIFVALLLAFIGMILGIFALCIGIIFTFPYYYSMVYAIYYQAIGFEEKSVIDEIGQEEI